MTLGERQRIFTFNIHRLIEYAYSQGFELSFGEAHRPQSQVLLNYYGYEIVYINGVLSLIKTTPKSKTLQSRHPERLAVDFNIFKNGVLLNKPIDIKPLGDFWESLNTQNVWGGDWDRDNNLDEETFKDPYHFEMRN